MCVCCVTILRWLWYLLMPLHLLFLMARSFRLWVPVLLEIVVVRRHGLRVTLLRFLWLCCCQYQVSLLWNSPGICLSFLEYLLLYRLLRFYFGRKVWMCPGLMVGGSSICLGVGFLVVTKCHTRVVIFRGLQLFRQLFSIWLVHLLNQKGVLVRWWRTFFPSSWSGWTTGLRLALTSVFVDKRFWNRLFWLVSWWLGDFPAYSQCCGAIVCSCSHNLFL